MREFTFSAGVMGQEGGIGRGPDMLVHWRSVKYLQQQPYTLMAVDGLQWPHLCKSVQCAALSDPAPDSH